MMLFSHLFLGCTIIGIGTFLAVYSDEPEKSETEFFNEPIPDETPDPINITTDYAIIKFDLDPIKFELVVSENLKVKNNGETVEATLEHKPSKTKVMNGVLSPHTYTFDRIKYLWTDDTNEPAATTIDKKGAPLEVLMMFYNDEYNNIEDACTNGGRYGLAIFRFLIRISEVKNKLFENYANTLKEVKIPEPEASNTTLGKATKWHLQLPPNATYYAYPGSYQNENMNEKYCALVLVFESISASMTEEQFQSTFGSLKNSNGESLIDTQPQFNEELPVVKSKGIKFEYMT